MLRKNNGSKSFQLDKINESAESTINRGWFPKLTRFPI